jgi:hypothetical protein
MVVVCSTSRFVPRCPRHQVQPTTTSQTLDKEFVKDGLRRLTDIRISKVISARPHNRLRLMLGLLPRLRRNRFHVSQFQPQAYSQNAPIRETGPRPQMYQQAPNANSFFHAAGGGPPGGGGGNGPADESSDYESEYEEDALNPVASRAKAARVKSHWRKYREFTAPLVLNEIPTHAGKFKAWRDQVRAELVNVSKAGHKAFLWVARIEDRNVHDNELKVPRKKWEPLDSKLRAAILKTTSGHFTKAFQSLTEEERVKHQRQISGAFMLRMIYRHFQTKDDLTQYTDYNELGRVSLP